MSALLAVQIRKQLNIWLPVRIFFIFRGQQINVDPKKGIQHPTKQKRTADIIKQPILNMKKTILLICILFLSVSIRITKANFLENPGHTVEIYSKDGAWCWFSDPRAIYYNGNYERTYVGYVTSTGDITISYYDHNNYYSTEVVIYPEFQVNDHVNPSLMTLPDGRLITFFTGHNGGFYFTRTKNPEDISEWEEISYLDLGPRLCYTDPVMLPSENNRIYIYLRGGYDWKPVFIYSDDLGETWSDPQTIVSHTGVTAHNRPYAKIISDGVKRVWFAINDGHPRVEPLNSIYVFYYKNGNFYQVDGTLITDINNLPIDQAKIYKAYDANETKARSWIWDIALDDNGYPRIAYTRLLEETRHLYYYAAWDGSSWEQHFLAIAGQPFPREERVKEQRIREPHYSGGIVLDPDRKGVVYYSRPVADRFEIFRSELKGEDWTETPITSNSELDNVRPYVARFSKSGSSPRLFWMSNRLYDHYTVYDSYIMMKCLK